MKTVISEAGPLSRSEREELAAEWLERTIAGLDRAQRKRARVLLRKKLEPKGPRGRRPRWDDDAYRTLLRQYGELRALGFPAAYAHAWLGDPARYNTTKVKELLRKARKLGPPITR